MHERLIMSINSDEFCALENCIDESTIVRDLIEFVSERVKQRSEMNSN